MSATVLPAKMPPPARVSFARRPASLPPRMSSPSQSPPQDRVYTAAFWTAFAANWVLVTANALSFRFAELVNFLDGTERLAGLTVSVATFGAVAARFRIGEALDRLGVRRVWVACAAVFTVGALILAAAGPLGDGVSDDTAVGWLLTRGPIFGGRLVFTVGLAGMFGCSLVHIQNLVPASRRTEAIGTFGSSGFLGMMTGTVLGDLLFAAFDGAARYAVLFGASAACSTVYLFMTLYLTRGERHARPTEHTSAVRLLIRHWPGNVTLVGMAMGLGFAVTTVFLTRFATDRGLTGIGPFFVGYAISAFTFRILTRRWSAWVGRHRMIQFGLAGQFVGLCALPLVTQGWQLVPPAISFGFGHALLFPAVVSLGTETFPLPNRGTGSTLILGFFDFGMLVTAPLLGGVIDGVDHLGGDGFPPMFLTAAALVLGVGLLYSFTTARRPDRDLVAEQAAAAERGTAAELSTQPLPVSERDEEEIVDRPRVRERVPVA